MGVGNGRQEETEIAVLVFDEDETTIMGRWFALLLLTSVGEWVGRADFCRKVPVTFSLPWESSCSATPKNKDQAALCGLARWVSQVRGGFTHTHASSFPTKY